jgi:antitoxin PrlF
MSAIEEVSTVTAKGQTTVPKAVRQALGVGYGGRIVFRIEEGGAVTIRALDQDEGADPALAPFLALVEADIAGRPSAVRPLSEKLASQMTALASDVGESDPDAPIEGQTVL